MVACDSGTPAEALLEAERLARAGVEVHLETNGIHLLEATPPPATLVKSPGVPWHAEVVGQARLRDITVIGELELGWRLVPNEFIAVTGTNGKTTTVELIGAIHRAAGEPVAVAGNVGTPVSSLAGRMDHAATVVCEASSFQLEDADAFAPEAAVFLNISEDHLDRHASMSDYRAAKLRLFAHQRLSDLAVLNGDDAGLLSDDPLRPVDIVARTVTFGLRPSNDVRLEDGWIVWNGERVIDSREVRLRGKPNLYNAMAAATVCLERGIGREPVCSALREFPGLPHRLEHVTEIDGVEYINDSKATNPGAASAAMETIGGGLHVILGGSLKGDTEFHDLDFAVSLGSRAVYLIGEAADRIAAALESADVEIVRCGDLPRAVAEASRRARPGEKVLLSPACASFDQYRDYEERGEHFKELVRMLAVKGR